MAGEYNAFHNVETFVKIRIGEIPSFGVDKKLSIEEAWVRSGVEEAAGRPVRRFACDVHIDPPDHGGAIEVQFRFGFDLHTDCDRCGVPIDKRIDEVRTLRYSRGETETNAITGTEDIELGEDDLDAGWYRLGTLSLADALSEAVALALPMRTACEDVAGCDVRTAEMLERAAQPTDGHPGFAALKNWT